jgi:hypothetical protein
VNPKIETRRKDALCSEWRHNGEDGKVVSAHGGVQSAGPRTDESRELRVQRKLLYTRRYQFEGRPEPRHANLATTAEERKEKHLLDEIAKLKAALAEKTLENDFFANALLRIKEGRQQSITLGASASTTESGPRRKSKAD